MNQSSSAYNDDELFSQLAGDDVKAFERLFKKYYKELCQFSYKYVHQPEITEEIVSGIYTHIWEKRRQLQVSTSVKAYLYTSVKNASINYLKSQYARQRFLPPGDNENSFPVVSTGAESIEYKELQAIIEQGIQSLPEKCRIIFHLSRNAGLSYEEIAKELGISRLTVKAQMGIALQKLRTYVGNHWDKMLVLIFPIF